jgi:Asp-tRNA(Asn)/Glu-tRNA(Gln) amidotransferase A subunit family amidase
MVSNGSAWDICNDFKLSGERLTLGLYLNMLLLGAGRILRGFINLILKATGMGRTVEVTKNVKKLSSHDYDNIMRKRYEFAYEFSEKWQKAGVSAIVTPVFPHCSFRGKHSDDMGLMLEYIFLWAILYYPTGIVPVTSVANDEQSFTDSYNDGWTKLIDETAKGSEGMPISVQVISHTYEDEKALAIM